MQAANSAELFHLRHENNRYFVPVTWRWAEDLQTRLRRRGFFTTLFLDPTTKEAWLEFWPDLNPDKAAAALAELRSEYTTT